MKKITLLVFVLLLSFIKVSSQISFVKTYSSPTSISEGFSIVEDISGGYLFSGMSLDTVTDSIYTFLAKCDPLGMISWVKNYDTAITYPTIKRFSNGDLLMAGGQSIMKLDNSGNVLWSKQISGIIGIPMHGFIITSDGGIAISAYLQIQADFALELIKLDSMGNVIWSRETLLSANSIWSNRIIETLDGGLLTAFDGYVTNLANQIFVIKTDALGNLSWSESFGSTNVDHITDIIQSADGNYLLTGSVSGTTCIFKLDTSGTSMWSKSYGQNVFGIAKMLETTSGNLILSGSHRDSLANGVLVLSTDANGDILNARSYPGVYGAYVNDIYATYDMGYIAVCGDGIADPENPQYMQLLKLIKMDSLLQSACDFQIYNLGTTSQTISPQLGMILTPGSVSSNPITINQYPYQMTPIVVCESINVEEIIIDNQIELYPNPSSTKLNIEIISGLIQKIAIYDLAGKLIRTISCNNSKLEIDISTLSPGIYFLNGKSDQRIFRKRFVKN